MIVSNSSPLMNLAIVGHLEILRELFNTISIPEEVWSELTIEGRDKPGTKEIIQASWIKRVPIKNMDLFQLLQRDLDDGESEAITLAVENRANLILLDETDARNIAEFYRLPKVGIIGILMRAKKLGLIKEIKPILLLLRNKANFWIKQDLYQKILSEMGEAVRY